jgi:ankyrin repeat protein
MADPVNHELYALAQRGDAAQVRAWFAQRPQCDALDASVQRALNVAIRNDHERAVAEFPWCQDAYYSSRFDTLAHNAAHHGSVHVVAFFVARKATTQVDLERYLSHHMFRCAALSGHVSCVHLLVCLKADVNFQPLGECGALHCAVQKGHTDVAQYLVRANTNVNRPDIFGRTAVYVAASQLREATLRALLDEHADINMTAPHHNVLTSDSLDKTALAAAVANWCPDTVVKMLLRAKADVHAAGPAGITALHYAAQHGRRRTARILVRAKADLRATTIHGDTAEALACSTEVADFLRALARR